jgi:hypothetical protein
MVCQQKPPSQTWRTFLENHVKQLGFGPAIQLPELGVVVELTQVGGLHHRAELPEGTHPSRLLSLLQLNSMRGHVSNMLLLFQAV